jgi:hypothetical protein
MATFAELDANYVVLGLYKVRDEDCCGGNFPESEPIGIQYLDQTFGPGRIWKQCSIHGNFRKNSPRIGEVYDEMLDAFIPKQPYPSWILTLSDCHWGAPVPYPEDGRFPNPTKVYRWDEPTVSWIEVGPFVPPPSPPSQV